MRASQRLLGKDHQKLQENDEIISSFAKENSRKFQTQKDELFKTVGLKCISNHLKCFLSLDFKIKFIKLNFLPLIHFKAIISQRINLMRQRCFLMNENALNT